MMVANQTSRLYEIRGWNIMEYAVKVKTLGEQFKTFKVQHVPRLKKQKSGHIKQIRVVIIFTFGEKGIGQNNLNQTNRRSITNFDYRNSG